MNKQYDPNSEVRAAFAMRELTKAQRSISGGPVSMFIRIILALIFMYLSLVSYQVFGEAGLIFISILFIIAVFVPVLYQAVNASLIKRREHYDASPRYEETPAQQES
jgi:quinol-cytochrome oxidoreductase complex cytochrome b subunit